MDYEFTKMVQHQAVDKILNIIIHTGVETFEEKGNEIELKFNNGKTILVVAVVIAIGVKPENALAKAAGLDFGVTGLIAINDFKQTSDPNIYTFGDTIEVSHFNNKAKVQIP